MFLVNDGAVDGSARIMHDLGARFPLVRLIWSRNFGQHAATLADMASTVSAWMATLDEDVASCSAFGIACACVGMLYALFVVTIRFIFQATITGWASLMVVVLVIGGVQMTMLGVIGEYVWRVLDEARGRPPFVVAERIGFEDT